MSKTAVCARLSACSLLRRHWVWGQPARGSRAARTADRGPLVSAAHRKISERRDAAAPRGPRPMNLLSALRQAASILHCTALELSCIEYSVCNSVPSTALSCVFPVPTVTVHRTAAVR